MPGLLVMPLCQRRFEQIGIQLYRELLQPLFPDWDYSGEWGKKEAEQVLDRVEQYHQEVPFMLNQLKLIPDSVIQNTPQGAKFKRPASACQFVGQLLRMAGLRTISRQCRVDGGERARFYRIDPESLAIMQHYAHSRAVYKEVRVSHPADLKNYNGKSVTVHSNGQATGCTSQVTFPCSYVPKCFLSDSPERKATGGATELKTCRWQYFSAGT